MDAHSCQTVANGNDRGEEGGQGGRRQYVLSELMTSIVRLYRPMYALRLSTHLCLHQRFGYIDLPTTEASYRAVANCRDRDILSKLS
jgi:hypothetical protein